MPENDTLFAALRTQAADALADIFAAIASRDGMNLEEAEDLCIEQGHLAMSQALSRALERLDAKLCAALPDGIVIHDRRSRTLATKMGDVAFRYRRCRDGHGNAVVPLADALDVPWGSRISPAASAFLVEAGADVSFASSARLLERAGGSRVSPTSVMRRLHGIGELCAEQDRRAAEDLFSKGVLPEADSSVEEVCIEADGTWLKRQRTPAGESDRIEIKAMVAYAGKARKGSKTHRVGPVRHGCVGAPGQFWTQAVAALGTRYDLGGLKACHMGTDGEHAYRDGVPYFKGQAVDAHLDPFHVNRAILSCFRAGDRRLANNVLGHAIDGEVETAIRLIEAAMEGGIAKKNAGDVVGYLRNNLQAIYSGGPSLGTMESEQQHVYGCRMDAFPCAWTPHGADSMARIRSRKASKRSLPRPTREQSVTRKRRERTEKRILASLAGRIDTKVPQRVGRGYEAEHAASLVGASAEVRYAAGIDSGMIAINW
ncbi:UPF0236 family transposase-like protein [Desulfovibrio piger]|uniref:UPF0236 family transposase-like protein n=1 Tax=Desulfovibrio piger TaxID=901 RepID=UPI003F0509C9